ncbi:MAG: protein kinase [Phycisphaerales bacterium]
MTVPGTGPAPDRVAEVLDRALELPPEQRAAFVREAAGGDTALVREVSSLLRALAGAGAFLSLPSGAGRDALVGASIGPYRVEGRIGEGGMGVVYRARDERLGRSVALKVLPQAVATDPARRARLEREARALAALNHPNIGAIYGLEDDPGASGPVLVLELVRGETLASRLAKGPLAMDEAVAVASQIARALEAAHNAGVVHRDLKPANVVIDDAGAVKVLDFGLAKLAERVDTEVPGSSLTVDGAGSGGPMGAPSSHAALDLPHADALATQEGMVVGTAAYMSPEQARGKVSDKRADLWAFGCVLFELASGRRAFPGNSVPEVLDAVIAGAVAWGSLPAGTPPGVRRVMERCLRVHPDARLRDAGDARVELEEAMAAPAAPRRWGWWRVVGGAAVLLLAGVVGSVVSARPPASTPARSTSLVLPEGEFIAPSMSQPLRFTNGGEAVVLSAGPRRGSGMVYRRSLDSFTFERFEVEGVCLEPSPDGLKIAMWRRDASGDGNGRLVVLDSRTMKVVVEGPAMRPYLGGLAWLDDRRIVCSVDKGVLKVWDTQEGGFEPLTHEETGYYTQPYRAPRGRGVLATRFVREGGGRSVGIDLVSLQDGSRAEVLPDAACPRMLGGDILLFYRDAGLWAAQLDESVRHVVGRPVRVLAGLPPASDPVPFTVYDVSPRGALAFIPGTTTYQATAIAWVDETGQASPIIGFNRPIWAVRLSHDGSRAVVVTGEYGEQGELRVVDLGSNRDVSVASFAQNVGLPLWTRDDAYVVFNTKEANDTGHRLWRVRADGSAPPELLRVMPEGQWCDPTDVTPDGQDIIGAVFVGPGNVTDLFLIPFDGAKPMRKLLPTAGDRTNGRISPDGTVLVWAGSVSPGDRSEVYVQPYPALDRLVRVSQEGGFRVSWAAHGRRLAYRWGDSLNVVDIGPDLSVSRPLISLQDLPESRFDAAPEGTKFLMAAPTGGSKPANMIQLEEGFEQRVRAALRSANGG